MFNNEKNYTVHNTVEEYRKAEAAKEKARQEKIKAFWEADFWGNPNKRYVPGSADIYR